MTDLELIEQAQALILFGAGQTRALTALVDQFEITPARAQSAVEAAMFLLQLCDEAPS